MATLAEIRARLIEQAQKQEDAKNGVFNNANSEQSAFLPFWNIANNQPLNLRLLPDGDTSNDYFWREREMINLVFRGVKGQHTDIVKLSVPCNEMFVKTKDACPVLREVRTWYAAKDPELDKKASQYWKKKSYLFQCFIAPNSTPVENDNAPENPIRRILANKVIFERIKSILLNTGVSHLPTDYEHGRDLAIVKTKNSGGFADYNGTQWSMAERPLSDVELAAIEQYGLFDLGEFMPKAPNADELNAIEEMFQASCDGLPYDPSRWATFYRPAGVHKPSEGSADSTFTPSAKTQATSTYTKPAASSPAAQETETVTSTKANPAELLARLQKNRSA